MEKAEYGERLIGVTRIWRRLFLGSMYDTMCLARANPLGITTVVSLSETAPCNTSREIHYLHIPIEDAQPIPLTQFDAIIAAITENTRTGKVLLNCGSGISRGPVMVAAYLEAVGIAKFDTALEMIAGLRPIVAPSAILVASVREHLKSKGCDLCNAK